MQRARPVCRVVFDATATRSTSPSGATVNFDGDGSAYVRRFAERAHVAAFDRGASFGERGSDVRGLVVRTPERDSVGRRRASRRVAPRSDRVPIRAGVARVDEWADRHAPRTEGERHAYVHVTGTGRANEIVRRRPARQFAARVAAASVETTRVARTRPSFATRRSRTTSCEPRAPIFEVHEASVAACVSSTSRTPRWDSFAHDGAALGCVATGDERGTTGAGEAAWPHPRPKPRSATRTIRTERMGEPTVCAARLLSHPCRVFTYPIPGR